MRMLLFFCLFLSISFSGKAQVVFSAIKHNFGELSSSSQRYVDITVINNGAKDVLIFSVRKPREVTSIISKKRVLVGSSSVIRFQVNPVKKGVFSYDIEVFTNDKNDATVINLKGDLLEFEQGNNRSFTACPSFSERPSGTNPNGFSLTVVTIDKETKKELSQSSVRLIQKGQEVWLRQTDRRGEVKENATLGLSYFVATHVGYESAEMGRYINFKRNLVVIELTKDTSFVPEEELIKEPEVIASKPENKRDVRTILKLMFAPKTKQNQKPKQQVEKDFKTDTVATVQSESINTDEKTETVLPLLSDLEENNFDEQYFKPVNVVFILDISSSMKQADRIELMKYSLMQLTEILRPQDKFSIVTYASGVRVLLQPTSGAKKEMIKNEIKDLRAGGFTSGGEGIKLGYKTALLSKIDNGSNHVIIITDGAFNRDSQDYKKYIKKYKRKGIAFSVVGIKNKEKEEEAMRADAELGGGRYVPIMKLSDAEHNLKEEVRVVSYRR